MIIGPAVIIAIDGPAAAGKGTLARRLAAHLGLPYLDTGLLYRAVGRRVLDAEGDPADPAIAEAAALALQPEDTLRDDLRGPAADRAASAAHGAVLDGRDIGTVVFPDATYKLFVTASPEIRGERRWRELLARGAEADLSTVITEIRARDAADASRAAAPLKPAKDAVLIDTSAMDADAAFARAVEILGAH